MPHLWLLSTTFTEPNWLFRLCKPLSSTVGRVGGALLVIMRERNPTYKMLNQDIVSIRTNRFLFAKHSQPHGLKAFHSSQRKKKKKRKHFQVYQRSPLLVDKLACYLPCLRWEDMYNQSNTQSGLWKPEVSWVFCEKHNYLNEEPKE